MDRQAKKGKRENPEDCEPDLVRGSIERERDSSGDEARAQSSKKGGLAPNRRSPPHFLFLVASSLRVCCLGRLSRLWSARVKVLDIRVIFPELWEQQDYFQRCLSQSEGRVSS